MALWSWHRVSHKILNLQDSRVFVEQKPYRCLNYTLSRGSYKRCVHMSVCTAVREKRTHAPGPRHVHVTVSCWEGERKHYWASTHGVFEATFLQIPELPGGRGSLCRHDVKGGQGKPGCTCSLHCMERMFWWVQAALRVTRGCLQWTMESLH